MSKPKISLNKLGEYLQASATRRKTIVKDQQNPATPITAYYRHARKPIIDFLKTDMLDDAKLLDDAQNLRDSAITGTGTEWDINSRRASADAIEQFLEIADKIDLDGLVVESIPENQRAVLELSGVDVSIRPDAIFRDMESNEIKGLLKLHFPRENHLNDTAKHIATALRVYGENLENANINPKKCYVIDVFDSSVTVAPKTFKKNIKELEAACDEIRMRWNDNLISK